jgi:hypothetical protein
MWVVKFGYSPGDWRVETGRVHATKDEAIAEARMLHERFSDPQHQGLFWGQARPFAGVGPYYALRVVRVPSRDLPRRQIAEPARVQPPVLRKRVGAATAIVGTDT